MCLSLESKNVKSEIAEKDIIVYKYLYKRIDNKYVTPFQYFPMKIGKMYKSRLRKIFNSVENGLHSFVNVKDCRSKAIEDNAGIGNTLICQFTIPKGARIYRGHYGFHGNKVPSIASSRN
jgi:hypothetical protein